MRETREKKNYTVYVHTCTYLVVRHNRRERFAELIARECVTDGAGQINVHAKSLRRFAEHNIHYNIERIERRYPYLYLYGLS